MFGLVLSKVETGSLYIAPFVAPQPNDEKAIIRLAEMESGQWKLDKYLEGLVDS